MMKTLNSEKNAKLQVQTKMLFVYPKSYDPFFFVKKNLLLF